MQTTSASWFRSRMIADAIRNGCARGERLQG
jgi:hypothetical protein